MEISFWSSPSAKQHQNPCSGRPPVYQGFSTCHDWPVKKANVNLPIRLKVRVNKIQNAFPVSHPLVGGQDKDISTVSQMLLTVVRLCLLSLLFSSCFSCY